jgi:Ulp1 family protease
MSGPPTPQVVARPPPADRVDDSVALDIRTTLAPAGKWMSVDGIDAALLRMCAVSTGATVDSAGRLPVLVNPTNRAPRTARAFMVTFYHFLTVNRYSHAAVRRHTRQRGRNAVFPRGCNLFRDMELVFIPRNVGNAPWTLVVIDNRARTVSYLDSLRAPPGVAQACLRNVARYLEDEWAALQSDGVIAGDEQYRAYRTEITADVPQQPNQTDCGAYVLAFAHALLLKKPLTSIKADHIDYYRARWASCLLGQTAASHN